ncbi:hypothetical protein ACQJBY_050468 [Aegilops geniculata]
MAPIYGSQEFLDDLTIKVSRSVVLVLSFEPRGTRHQFMDMPPMEGEERDRYIQQNMRTTHYKSCTGFIIGVSKRVIFIAVHHSQINTAAFDTFSVRFHDNNEKAAKIFIKKTKSVMILSVEQPGHPYHPVRCSNKRIGRDDIFILSNVHLGCLNSYQSSVINPRTEAIANPADSDSIVPKSGKWFTFGCTTKIEELLGAPVFDFRGLFVGSVDTNHSGMWNDHVKCYSDLIYARHVRYFFRKARRKIEKKLMKERKKKMGG